MNKNKVDKSLLIIVLILVGFGFFIFASAALGLATKEGEGYLGTILSQLLIGVIGGLFAMYIFSKINYNFLKKYSLGILYFSINSKYL